MVDRIYLEAKMLYSNEAERVAAAGSVEECSALGQVQTRFPEGTGIALITLGSDRI